MVKKIVVIGAGVVGTTCALSLLKEGHHVTLIDKEDPGSQCSFGNAGTLGGNAHFPTPGMLLKVPTMLLNPREPLSIVWRDFPGLIPWFLKYVGQSTPQRAAEIAEAARSLNELVHESFVDLLNEIDSMDLLRWGGRLFAYPSRKALAAEEAMIKLKFQAGIEMKELSGAEARELEPALGNAVECAIYTPQAGHIVNPYRFVERVLHAFANRGGVFTRAEVTDFTIEAGRVRGVRTATTEIVADEIVMSAGAWSPLLGRKLGVALPIVAERGYHAMIKNPGVDMKIPTLWASRKVIVAPMENGIRVSGMSEFGTPETPPDPRKAEILAMHARELIPELRSDRFEPWMGPRPATPDYLPLIGRSAALQNVVFACGHGHSGLMFGPATAALVGQVVAGRRPTIDLSPFNPDRFNNH